MNLAHYLLFLWQVFYWTLIGLLAFIGIALAIAAAIACVMLPCYYMRHMYRIYTETKESK